MRTRNNQKKPPIISTSSTDSEIIQRARQAIKIRSYSKEKNILIDSGTEINNLRKELVSKNNLLIEKDKIIEAKEELINVKNELIKAKDSYIELLQQQLNTRQ